jgi:glutaryl-CoA dehydrogenase
MSAELDPVDLYNVRAMLGEDERLVQDSVAKFVDEQVIPIMGDCFEHERFPRELVTGVAELGLLGSSIHGYGCAGLNGVSYGLICQELERGDSGLRSFVSVQSSLCMYPIYAFGSEEQKQRWLPSMAQGETIACFGLTEPHGGSDPGNMKTHAKRQGKDWVLNGAKMWITNAPIADVAIVWARTDEGIRGFLVEKDFKGFTTATIKHKMSLRASLTGSLFFDNVVVPEENMLPGVVGLKGPLSCLTQARYGICWGVTGAAQACLKDVIDYTKTRILFGKPLAATQAIQIRLAEMARKITTSQMLSLQLGRLKDQGIMQPTQVSVAKWHNARAAIEVARDARDILGGAGISVEYSPIRHALNLESVITYEGTETVHQLTVGRALTGISAF